MRAQDLSTPTEGLYSFRSCLDGRVTFLLQLTEDMECQPATWVPEQLQRLAQLGMIGGFTGSDEVTAPWALPDSALHSRRNPA